MAEYDLVIRNGTVVDGSGMPGYRADVGVRGQRIVAIGRIGTKGRQDIDAEGQVVTPGFVDGHTHMDAQVFWDHLGTSSCWHGVTTVVVGNCGFTLAPTKADQREILIRNLEGVEDIPGEALAEGVPWGWERFREYLDAVERVPKGINYAAYIGHSALRTWAMGERGFEEAATEDDVALMAQELQDALRTGAVGFTTSRSGNHVASDGRPVSSRAAAWDEVVALVRAMAEVGGGIFELSNESVMSSQDPEARGEYMGRLRELAVTTGVPTTFGVTTFGGPHRWKELLELIDGTARAGGRMFGQSSGKEQGVLYSFKTWLPFDRLPEWREFRRLPLAEQAAILRRPDERRRLVAAAREGTYALGSGPARKPDYNAIFVLRQTVGRNPAVAAVGAERNADPVDVMIDLALETDFDQFFTQITGNADPAEAQAIMEHPRTVMTFTDSGAHVSQIINTSMHTHVLAYWVREREAFSLERAVRMMTLAPSTAWGFADRGLIREGFVADINVFDPARVAPAMPTVETDLPAGAKRLVQKAHGFLATIVAGEILLREGEHTGASPGLLIRRRSVD